MTATRSPAIKIEMLATFFKTLDEHSIPYCVLTGCDDYPNAVNSDVDFMVREVDLIRLPAIVARSAAKSRALLVQFIYHAGPGYCFVIARGRARDVAGLALDAASDYRIDGRLWLIADQLLARRRYDSRGFYVPADDDAFIYYLIKKIDKGALDATQALKLRRLFNKAPEACLVQTRQFWPAASVELFKRSFAAGNFAELQSSLPILAEQFRAASHLENIWPRAAQRVKELTRRFKRVRRPTGLFVVLLGPDGSGKSSVIEKMTQPMLPGFLRNDYFHLRPSLGSRGNQKTEVVTDPHNQTPRGFLGSTAKLLYLLGDYGVGYLFRVRPLLVRSSLVVFDRYYHDLLVDPQRYRQGGQLWLARLLGKLVPKPDLWVLLDAPTEVLQARKQEVPYAESSRQREAYLELVAGLPNGVVVDASRPLPEVVNSVNLAILSHMEKRTKERLKL